MLQTIRSFLAALFMAVAVYAFIIGVLAPLLPRAMGAPDVQVVHRERLPAAARVEVTGANGTVRVRTHADPDIAVEAVLSAYLQDSDHAAQALTMLEGMVSADADGAAVTIAAYLPDETLFLAVEADMTVFVPAGTHVEVENRNGNVWIGRGCGDVTVRGGNADVEAHGPRGDVWVETTNGRVRVLDAQRTTHLRTVNGNVYAHLSDGRLDAETVNGTVVARFLGSKAGDCRIATGNGGVVLNLPRTASVRIDAETARGRIRSDVPLERPVAAGAKKLTATLGSGEALIELATLNGNILIQYGSNP